MSTTTAQTTQVYAVFIRATPEQVWEAITTPSFTQQYFFGSRVTVTPETYVGLDADGGALVEGGVVEYDPPKRLVHGWRALYDPASAAEEESRVTWELEPQDGGVTKLTVVHDRLEASPVTAASVAGGWSYVLSGLKTLLETGRPLVG
ncbi:MAG TPA: SRPBCC family protein [Gaiellaceae bacterium]|nr:SRPBCC family protein [Gaiellaceae bacterium]